MSDKHPRVIIEDLPMARPAGGLRAPGLNANCGPPAKADPIPPGLGPKKFEPLADEVPRTHPMLRDFPDSIGVDGVYSFALERVEVEHVVARNIDTREMNPLADAFQGVVQTLSGAKVSAKGPRKYLSMTRRLRATWLLVHPEPSLRSAFVESTELCGHTFDADGAPTDPEGWAKLVAQLVEASRREAEAYVEDLIVKGSSVPR